MPIITEALSPFQLMPCLCFNESLQQNGFEWKVDRSLECRDQSGSYKHVKYQNADKCLGGGGCKYTIKLPSNEDPGDIYRLAGWILRLAGRDPSQGIVVVA